MKLRSPVFRFSQSIRLLSSVRANMPLRAKILAYEPHSRMKSTGPAPYKKQPGSGDLESEDVLFHNIHSLRIIELNRPAKYNALNYSMAQKILPQLQKWDKSQLAQLVLLKGAGDVALCAGGDVLKLAHNNMTGSSGQAESLKFFELEYQMDHYIANYSKPYIAVMDGITMGGGVGLSLHGPFRIATERTVFAMPETTIGFFPDVGASFFLPRMDGEIGTYLALTSARVSGIQTLFTGIATHYVHSSSLGDLEKRLSELSFRDSHTTQEKLDVINNTIEEYSAGIPEDGETFLTKETRESLDRCFKFNTVDEILVALETDDTEWTLDAAKKIRQRSPTSLRVALRALRWGKKWGIDAAFRNEYIIASKFMEHPALPDFVEGVTKQLSKSKSGAREPPMWSPPDLESTPENIVDQFFNTTEGTVALSLINPGVDYQSYPYAFGLPTDETIKAMVVKNSNMSKREFVDYIDNEWNGKIGVKEKVQEVLIRKVELDTGGGLLWKDASKIPKEK